MIKGYGVVFTCLTLRAVHMEVASSLDIDSSRHVLRRFIARRGQVQLICSDNGTNFEGAEGEPQTYFGDVGPWSIYRSYNRDINGPI